MLTVSEARYRYFAGAGVTLTRQTRDGSRSQGWLYAAARMGDHGPEMRGPGENNWLVVTGNETGPHAEPLRMLLSLMGNVNPNRVGVDKLMTEADRTRQTSEDANLAAVGVFLLPIVPCGKCGKPLNTPDSVREGFGPECGKRAADRAAKRAAKEAAMKAFADNASKMYQR